MQTDSKLKKRITYEKMLASLSERAVSVDDLNKFLDLSLKSMGSILDVSRIFIFEYQVSFDSFSCICEWVAKGIATLGESTRKDWPTCPSYTPGKHTRYRREDFSARHCMHSKANPFVMSRTQTCEHNCVQC
jgi:hypothetical protein